MSTKRLFIATAVPDEVVKEVQCIQYKLKSQGLFCGSFINPKNAHITLKFLGDTDEKLIPEIAERLFNIKFGVMYAQLGSLNLFSSMFQKVPRVIYCSIICPELAGLARRIDEALLDLYESKKRSFAVHLTIARIKYVDDFNVLKNRINSLKVNPIRFEIDSFDLKESILSSSGPSYNVIQTYALIRDF